MFYRIIYKYKSANIFKSKKTSFLNLFISKIVNFKILKIKFQITPQMSTKRKISVSELILHYEEMARISDKGSPRPVSCEVTSLTDKHKSVTLQAIGKITCKSQAKITKNIEISNRNVDKRLFLNVNVIEVNQLDEKCFELELEKQNNAKEAGIKNIKSKKLPPTLLQTAKYLKTRPDSKNHNFEEDKSEIQDRREHCKEEILSPLGKGNNIFQIKTNEFSQKSFDLCVSEERGGQKDEKTLQRKVFTLQNKNEDNDVDMKAINKENNYNNTLPALYKMTLLAPNHDNNDNKLPAPYQNINVQSSKNSKKVDKGKLQITRKIGKGNIPKKTGRMDFEDSDSVIEMYLRFITTPQPRRIIFSSDTWGSLLGNNDSPMADGDKLVLNGNKTGCNFKNKLDYVLVVSSEPLKNISKENEKAKRIESGDDFSVAIDHNANKLIHVDSISPKSINSEVMLVSQQEVGAFCKRDELLSEKIDSPDLIHEIEGSNKEGVNNQKITSGNKPRQAKTSEIPLKDIKPIFQDVKEEASALNLHDSTLTTYAQANEDAIKIVNLHRKEKSFLEKIMGLFTCCEGNFKNKNPVNHKIYELVDHIELNCYHRPNLFRMPCKGDNYKNIFKEIQNHEKTDFGKFSAIDNVAALKMYLKVELDGFFDPDTTKIIFTSLMNMGEEGEDILRRHGKYLIAKDRLVLLIKILTMFIKISDNFYKTGCKYNDLVDILTSYFFSTGGVNKVNNTDLFNTGRIICDVYNLYGVKNVLKCE